MSYTLYSKIVPGCTAEILGDADSAGRLPAFIRGDHPVHEVLAASVDPEEWSDVELVPVPDSVPSLLYGVISGHVSAPTIDVVFSEREAIHALTVPGVHGYVPLYVPRSQMVPISTS